MHYAGVITALLWLLFTYHSVVESFEVVVSIYAQQLPLNENQTFTMPSLTLYAELVSSYVIVY